MWKKYLLNRIFEEKDIVNKLLEVDGIYNFDTFNRIINNEININNYYDTYLIENSPLFLINIIEKLMETNKRIIVCTMDNYAINSFIINKYKDFIKENNIQDVLEVDINTHFKINDNRIISIGSTAFNNEMNSIYKNIKSIDYEF